MQAVTSIWSMHVNRLFGAPAARSRRQDAGRRGNCLHQRASAEVLEERALLSAVGFADVTHVIDLPRAGVAANAAADHQAPALTSNGAALYLSNELLVQFQPGASGSARDGVCRAVQAALVQSMHTSAMIAAQQGVLERISLPVGMTVEHAKQVLEHNPNVRYAEPNWVYSTQALSDDPYYTTSSNLWGMYSDDSPAPVGPTGTTSQYGSQAEEAWNAGYTGSSSVVVGIIDEGFQYAHPDLAANSWTNPFDPIDGIDNDGNGYVDDIHGWDFFNNDNSTYDGTVDDHGTHVAGTIGGEGGNAIGVAGVNWDVTMISTKFLGPSGGSTSGAIAALDYLTDLKVRHDINIVATNNSWGGGGFSQALQDAITRAANQGILFVAAAGNYNSNNDSTAFYPSSYSTLAGAGYEAVIAVASINSSGAKSSSSSYGATTVDLGAPGEAIYSSVPTDSYASYSGTSMATPHVTGAAALYASVNPTATADQIRDAILNTTTATASLAGITVTGGHLNISALLLTPTLTINSASVYEGFSGTKTLTFTVTLSSFLALSEYEQVTVDYETADGTATAGSDYVATSGSLSFVRGDRTKEIIVTINGDTVVEANETFFVNLTNASSNASVADSQGQGTILNDGLTINNASVYEGNSGTKTVTFTVALSSAQSEIVTVDYATANGTATADSDYVATSGLFSFVPGDVLTRDIMVTINGDTVDEANETFFVNLTNASSNASIADSQGQGTIQNDDHPIAPPSGLISWWSGDGSANDLAGKNNGTLNNGATFAAGFVGNAFSLDGVDDYIRVPNDLSLNPSAGMTIEAWIKSDSTAGARDILSKWNDNTGDRSYIFKDHNGSDKLRMELYGLADLPGSTSITVGTWTHVAASYDNNVVCLYVNGVLDASIAAVGSMRSSVTDLLIGAVFTGGGVGEYFDGLIDELSMYNRALLPGEVQSIYDAGPAGKIKPSTYSNTTAKAITDGGTTSSTIVVADGGTILDVNVRINVTHTSDADLDIFLKAPNGVRVELTTDNGGTGDHYTNTIFDDGATTAITAGTAPFFATYRPEGLLSNLNGAPVAGTWTLEIGDDTKGQKGTLKSWSLMITRGDSAPSSLVSASSPAQFSSLQAAGGAAIVSSDTARLTVVTHEAGRFPGDVHDGDEMMAESPTMGMRRSVVEHHNTALVDQVFGQPDDQHTDSLLGALLDERLKSHRPWFKRRR